MWWHVRLTQKPWRADPFLHETFNSIIRGNRSIASVIFNSDVFKTVFNARVPILVINHDAVKVVVKPALAQIVCWQYHPSTN